MGRWYENGAAIAAFRQCCLYFRKSLFVLDTGGIQVACLSPRDRVAVEELRNTANEARKLACIVESTKMKLIGELGRNDGWRTGYGLPLL
jgi:hypothetical protein